MSCFFLVPSLKVGGGSREVLRLADELARAGVDTEVISMWHSPQRLHSGTRIHLLSRWKPDAAKAIFELPVILFRFVRWLREWNARAGLGSDRSIFTHYSTFPLALVVPREKRCFFVQGLEWRFVSSPIASSVLRHVVLYFYRR